MCVYIIYIKIEWTLQILSPKTSRNFFKLSNDFSVKPKH